MVKDLWDLIVGFGRAGLLGYGGGPSSIPLVENEAVNNFGWLTREEFGEILAMGNALPGPIATKMAGYIGYKVAGVMGAVAAVAATVVPTILIMVLLVVPLLKYKDVPFIKGMISGVKPVIFVMLAMLAFDFSKFAFAGTLSFGIAVVSFAAIYYFQINPGWVVLAALLTGGFFFR